MTTLAVRNNNPTNIRASHHGLLPWQGQLGTNEGFCVFKTAVYGFRAAAKIVHAYAGRGICTVVAIVRTWAPPKENDTDAYVSDVCLHSGFSPDTAISTAAEKATLLKAMAMHESGGWFFAEPDLVQGIALA
jgi:hypothetical protein